MDKQKQTQILCYAIERDLTETIDTVLAEGCDLNHVDEEGRTPLMLAIKKRNVPVIQKLIAAGASVGNYHHKRREESHLFAAIDTGSEVIVKLLIDAGADVNTSVEQRRALEFAASVGDPGIIKLLLDAGATRRHNALMVALQKENEEAARVLYDEGEESFDWEAVFCAACFVGDTDTVREFLAAGANPNIVFAYKLGYKYWDDDDSYDDARNKMTPLMFAALSGQADVIKVLVEAGAKLNTSFRRGPYDECFTEICDETALMFAAKRGHENAVQCLLAAGASVNKTTIEGETALDYAKRGKHQRVIEILLAAGAKE